MEPSSSSEFHFDLADFQQIAAMLHADSGISLPESKASLVYGRLIKRLRALGLSCFKDYCQLVADAEGIDERQRMLAALTTNVTAFFRERHHFDLLKSTVLPPLLRKARSGGRVRIWSAGCSKGHEPFSIAITVLDVLPEAASYDVKILATDIDPFVIAHAREGVYSREDIADVPKEAQRLFKSGDENGTVVATEALTRLVSFKELNLVGPWPMTGAFDVIFCRNVTIYFNQETQASIWARYAAVLRPEGHLLIGHSERLSEDVQSKFVSAGTTAYRLKSRAAA